MPDGMPESPRDATTVLDRLIDDFVLARLQGRAVDLDTLVAGLDAHHQREVRRRLDALEKTGFGRGQVLPAQLGEFTPEAELGRGGMSVVYRARQTSLERVVALKVLATAGSSAHDSERFLREAQALARLHHPGIVPVLSAGKQDGLLWFAMELVDGSSLANLLAAIAATPPKHRTAEQLLAPLGPHSITATATSYVALIARIVADAAEALEHAHGCGILHRDIKPSNIMIDRTGRVRLIDFGLARARDGSSMELTHTHELLGSPSWLPPELLRTPKREPSPRGDIYSLGVVLYEALAGRRPHVAGDVSSLLRKIANVPATPLQRFHRGLPRDLVTICHTAIEPDPVRRYANAHAFGKDLKAVLAFEPIAARPPNLGRRSVLAARRHPRTAAATALALGGVLLLSGTVVFQSVQRARHRRTLVSTIEGLAANGSLEEADTALRRLDGLAPEHPDTRRVARVVAEAHCAELTHRAQALARELAGARVDWEQLDKRIVNAMISARTEHVPREREQQALADRLGAAKLEARLRASYQTVVTLSERAAIDTRLSSEASTAKLHAALAEALMEGWRHALRRGDQEWIRLCADRVRVLDHPRRFASELTARSQVALTGEGAQVFLFRYVPCHDLRGDELSARWVPVPCSCDGSLHAGPFGSFRPGDTCLVVRDATDAGLLPSDLILTIGDEPAALGYRIRTVIPESAAARAGVEPYARLVSVGGQPAADWWQIRATLDSRQDVEVHVRQNGQVIRYHATWREDTYDTLGAVLEHEHLLLWDAPPPRALRLGILRGGQPATVDLPAGRAPGIRAVTTAYPLALTPECLVGTLPIRKLDLPPGEYLAACVGAGGALVRVLIEARPGLTSEFAVESPEGAPPADAVWVSGGVLRRGTDPLATTTGTSQGEVRVPGFWLARLETTVAEWNLFTSDPRIKSRIEAAKVATGRLTLVPRDEEELQVMAVRQTAGQRFAVKQISAQDVAAYIEWRNAEFATSGSPWRVRLPTRAEWQFAAGSTEARVFPWGDTWEAYLTNARWTLPRARRCPVGTRLGDESPYGVLDLAGSAAEMTADSIEGGLTTVCGGSSMHTDPNSFRIQSDDAVWSHVPKGETSFRLVYYRAPN